MRSSVVSRGQRPSPPGIGARTSATALVAVIMAGIGPATAGAQTPATAPPPASSAAEQAGAPLTPPVVTFGPEGLSLEEALRLTLRHDPNLLLGIANVERLAGVRQEQSGVFDLTLFGNVEDLYRIQELTEARKNDERDKRRRLRESLDATSGDVTNGRRSLDLLRQIRSLPPGSEAQQLAALRDLSPSLATQVQALNALIATQPEPQRSQLLDARNALLDTSIRTSDTQLSSLIASFEDSQANLANLGEAPDDEVFWNTKASLQFSKLFRTGVTVAPFVDYSQEGTNFRGKEKSADFGGKGVNDLHTLRSGISFTLPLKRGRGADAVAAGERSAAAELEAGGLALEHERAVSVLTTAQVYWELRAAQDSLAVVERSAGRFGDLLKSTSALVQGGELARVEQSRAQAGEARAVARVQDARRRLHEARVGLAIVLGVAATGDASSLPAAARDPFPTSPSADALKAWLASDAAPGQRRDLDAARKREEAAAILERYATTNLRSRLDLTAETYYTALGEVGPTELVDDNGNKFTQDFSFGDVIDRWVGPSVTLKLDLEKPLGNNAARGRLASAEADRRSRQIEAADLRRQIRLAVTRTVQTLAETVGRLQQVQAAVGYYGETIKSEISRFRASEATLINTIQTEQQATEAELQLIAAQQEVANLLAQLRFETGTLVAGGAAPAANLVTVPGRQP